MFTTILTAFLAASAGLASATYIPPWNNTKSGVASITPHDKYGSSVGVLGCKINTNRVAYWPLSVDCNDICIKISHQGRSVHVLRIDESQGAHDISYDAWNYLVVGKGAAEEPQQGPGISMEWEVASPDQCEDLLDEGGKLPLSASNSMNYLSSCLAQPSSYVAQHHALYNILTASCTWGVDERCTLAPGYNQPDCPGILGLPVELKDRPVTNIAYGTGKPVVAV